MLGNICMRGKPPPTLSTLLVRIVTLPFVLLLARSRFAAITSALYAARSNLTTRLRRDGYRGR